VPASSLLALGGKARSAAPLPSLRARRSRPHAAQPHRFKKNTLEHGARAFFAERNQAAYLARCLRRWPGEIQMSIYFARAFFAERNASARAVCEEGPGKLKVYIYLLFSGLLRRMGRERTLSAKKARGNAMSIYRVSTFHGPSSQNGTRARAVCEEGSRKVD
jgi:hypothetical protein